jgi:protocatechuate 3,4-dioxygenase beta subunit
VVLNGIPPGRLWSVATIGIAGLVVAVVLAACSAPPQTAESTTTTVTTVATTTTTTTASVTTETPRPRTTTTVPGPPPRPARYVAPDNEVAREAKQLAADIISDLTTYERGDDPLLRYLEIAGTDGLDDLAEAAAPLTLRGHWSRGEIIYPQLGGLTDDKVSLMTVTRQTVGVGPDPLFSIVRTLDIRLVMGDDGWEFDFLASAGGVFENLDELELAHAVASDPRIEMADSARLDILSGLISPRLLALMLEIADRTPYAITVMATGHPYHVFETDRVSHHSVGRAIDIHRVGENLVIDDRDPGTDTADLVQWLWQHPMVVQVGAPTDVDPPNRRRSFANTVHQDHIHVAVIGANDPDWFPAIGNRVWEDSDGDGIQDEGEPGIGGVDVTLFDAGGRAVGSTTTSSSGTYEFRNLYYGDYHVEIDIPSGYFATQRNRGDSDASDSDIDRRGDMSPSLLDPREHDTSRDAGLYRLASLGSRVWEDLDADGIQDEDEPGFADITVHLYDDTGELVASTVTDADGEYRFDDLVPGVYSLEIFRAGGYVPTLQDQGEPDPEDPGFDPDTEDSDVDESGVTEPFTLYSGEHQDRWDAGLVLSASLGDRVWEDVDADGIQDAAESGIAGVAVHLFRDGDLVASTVTGSDGSYVFEDLIPGEYHVAFDGPAGFVATVQDQRGDDAVDSDIDADGVTASTTLAPGEVDTRWDAGFRPVP